MDVATWLQGLGLERYVPASAITMSMPTCCCG